MQVTEEVALEHGLTKNEYAAIKSILNRTPTLTELGIFSVMWSEHCSYKHSRPLLATLPVEGERVLQGPGENAGAVDIGEGLALVFKIESHNHPSAVEPFEGAATGVGGILRDIFTMGARPIALLDSLSFGELDNPRTRYLLKGVVNGISHYGNCVGVPTVGGELQTMNKYKGNPLVNAMCVGFARHEEIISARASGPGNPVYYFGNPTGRDGIHGATFASEELGEDKEEKRPSVQVGDPFTEKLIMEASLELIASGCLVSIQDMGAAGLTCSASEMAEKGGLGITIDLDKVPQRAKNMTSYEIMLSESQERMLAVCQAGKEDVLHRILKKWELEPCKIGYLTDDKLFRVNHKSQEVACIPVHDVAEGAPVCEVSAEKPAYVQTMPTYNEGVSLESWQDALQRLVAHPHFASKRWIYEQYDYMVQTNTVVRPGQDAALLRLKDSDKAVSVTTDTNGYYCYLDPEKGGKIVVAQAARNCVAAGAQPLAVTNCLNFGNPENPEIYWQFQEVIKGMRQACQILETPVTGGNVSLYNETRSAEGKVEAIYPTPVIGMVGLLENVARYMTAFFKKENDGIYLVGKPSENLGGSQYLKILNGEERGPCPEIDLQEERKTQQFILRAIRKELFSSVHDVSEGGIMIALLESLLWSGKEWGALLQPDCSVKNRTAFLFSEIQSSFLVSVGRDKEKDFLEQADQAQVPVVYLGKVTEKPAICWEDDILHLAEMRSLYEKALENTVAQ